MPNEAHLTTNLRKLPLMSGALAVVLGGMVLWPGISTVAVAILFGVYLVASGVIQVITGLIVASATRGQALLLVSGATSIVLGVLAFRHLSNTVLLLGIGIGLNFLFRGMMTMLYGINDRGADHADRTIFFGWVIAAAGVVLMALPFSSMLTLAQVVGICLVALGLLEIIFSCDIRMSAKNHIRSNADTTVPSPSTQATSANGRSQRAAG